MLGTNSTASADSIHLNVDHREIVQLRLAAAFDSACEGPFLSTRSLQQVLTTGKLANNEFKVPAGKELIITDVTYVISRVTGSWTGNIFRPRLIPKPEGTPANLFNATVIADLPPIKSPTTGNEPIFGVVNFTAGVRVASINLRRSCLGLGQR